MMTDAPHPEIADSAVSAVVANPRRWITEVAVPYWASAGVDGEKGGFFDRLNLEGQPVPEDVKHVKYQARQIYAFCHAHALGAGDEALAVVRDGWRFLSRRGWDVQGGWVHTITRAGRPLDATKDLYDHAFVIMALAWLARTMGDDEPLRLAERTIAFLDRKMVDPHGGGGGWGGYHERSTEGLMEIPLPRRQNPHMHLLEAVLAMYETTRDTAWLDRARRLVDLALGFMIDPATGQLGEYFVADWRPADGAAGAVREPGHHFEWVWLLLTYRGLTGDDRVVEPADRLYRFGLLGTDEAGDGPVAPVDETDPEGRFVRDTKRLWCQTEAIKAFVARAEHLDDADAADRARRHLAALFTSHMSPDSPVWRDQLSRNGTEVSTTIPAGNLYHIVLALAEADRVLGPRVQPAA